MSTDNQREDVVGPLAPGLYLVATPIGNLEDITLRALRVLRSADRIACEDTRQTQKLLNHYGIRTPTVSYHRHNEADRTAELMEALKSGARIAVVSDAGTPGIADPGGQIALAAIAAGVPVFPIPGANAAISALIASGLAGTGPAGDGATLESFTFHGFLPAKEGQRRTALEALRGRADGTLIFYEAPHRILDTLADVEVIFGATQHVVVARELTKIHEEFLRGAVSEVLKTLAERATVSTGCGRLSFTTAALHRRRDPRVDEDARAGRERRPQAGRPRPQHRQKRSLPRTSARTGQVDCTPVTSTLYFLASDSFIDDTELCTRFATTSPRTKKTHFLSGAASSVTQRQKLPSTGASIESSWGTSGTTSFAAMAYGNCESMSVRDTGSTTQSLEARSSCCSAAATSERRIPISPAHANTGRIGNGGLSDERPIARCIDG